MFETVQKLGRTFGRKRTEPVDDPIEVLQRALMDATSLGLTPMVAALEATVQRGLWCQRAAASGKPFESFGKFAVALAPNGLGVRSDDIKRLKGCTRTARLIATLRARPRLGFLPSI